MKYALACARNRPIDTVVMQKTFFEVFKQQQGEYLGSILSGWLESMLPMVRSDGEMEVGDEMFEKGLTNAVKGNDRHYPPDWRLSYGARSSRPEETELECLRRQLATQQERLKLLERKLAGM